MMSCLSSINVAAAKDIKRTRNNTNVVFSEKNRFRIFFKPLINDELFIYFISNFETQNYEKKWKLTDLFNLLIGTTAVSKNAKSSLLSPYYV